MPKLTLGVYYEDRLPLRRSTNSVRDCRGEKEVCTQFLHSSPGDRSSMASQNFPSPHCRRTKSSEIVSSSASLKANFMSGIRQSAPFVCRLKVVFLLLRSDGSRQCCLPCSPARDTPLHHAYGKPSACARQARSARPPSKSRAK